MLCRICRNEIPYDAAFCEHCGAPVSEAAGKTFPETDAFKEEQGKEPDNGADITGCKVTENICLCPDGKYRWVCERPMTGSFFFLFEVWRVLALSTCLVIVVLAVISLLSGNGPDGVIGAAGTGLLVLAILMVLSLPAYWIVTKANNGKYTVLFEMDEDGIDHTQIKTDKAKVLEALTVLAGKRTGNRTVAGAGALSAAGTSLYSRFSDVRKIEADASECLIRLKGRLIRNQVYTDQEHYDFVLDYITSHCPKAEIAGE